MNKLNIKPLSINKCFQGRRYKTKEYTQYENDVLMLLKHDIIPEGKLVLHLEFGFSNIQSDWDNPIKPFVDILQKKYGFNDNRIYEAHVKKVKVKKGEDYVKYEILPLEYAPTYL